MSTEQSKESLRRRQENLNYFAYCKCTVQFLLEGHHEKTWG